MKVLDPGPDIIWLGHDTFKISGEKVIFTDPFKLSLADNVADIILLTHGHFDHCSPDDVAKVSKPDTTTFVSMTHSLICGGAEPPEPRQPRR